MTITVENGKETVLCLSGQLDTLSSIDFEKEITQTIQSDVKSVVLDCAGLTYISSAGLRLLLTLQKGLKAKQGLLRLVKVRKEIMDIFNITGFSSFLTIEQ